MKAIIQHPRTAWWLACFTCALFFVFPIFLFTAIAPQKKYTQEVTIRTSGTTGDVVSAVENLKRNDLVISSKRNPLYENTVGGTLGVIGYLALFFALISALVSAFEKRLQKSLGTKSDNN